MSAATERETIYAVGTRVTVCVPQTETLPFTRPAPIEEAATIVTVARDAEGEGAWYELRCEADGFRLWCLDDEFTVDGGAR